MKFVNVPNEPDPEKSFTGEFVSQTVPKIDILLAEDNPGDVVLITQLLEISNIHCTLTHVTTLKESLIYCQKRNFDIVLLDLGLPDSVGLETLKKIRATDINSPVIIMTGLDDEETALASLREGALDYLVKNRLSPDYITRSLKYSIERKKILDMQKKHIRQFSILSSTSTVFNELDDIPLSLSVICDELGSFLGKSGVNAFEFCGTSAWRISGVGWLRPWAEQIRSILGWDTITTVFRKNSPRRNLSEILYDGRLHEIKGGMGNIFEVKKLRLEFQQLETIMGITHIYAIGFSQQKELYGGFLIFTQHEIDGDDIEIIEAISSRTSLNIQRKIIEKELRISENRLKKLNSTLELKVTQRTRELKLANNRLHQELKERILAEEALKKKESQLKELNATKDKFFNIVAHDLKNPFTSLLGSTEVLFENIHRMDHQNIKALATILNDSAKSGYAILQNLLDWSRSQTGLLKFTPDVVNLSGLIDENIKNLSFLASNKDINIYSDVEKNMEIFTDVNMVNTVLRNLLSNSIKFTHRGGKVVVSTSINDSDVIISVKDTGIGIPPENIDKLFRIESKLSVSGTENEQGTGLGLKLCKEFVEKLSGEIWVTSKVNSGTTFSFTIPFGSYHPLSK